MLLRTAQAVIVQEVKCFMFILKVGFKRHRIINWVFCEKKIAERILGETLGIRYYSGNIKSLFY